MATNPLSYDQLLGLIQQLYAAPGSKDGWTHFLDSLCAAVDGYCAHFISVDQRGHASLALTVRSDPAAMAAYAEHWGAFDPWGHSRRLRSAASGSVIRGDEMITHSQLQRTAFYADFGRPNDLVRCMAGMIEAAPEGFSVISIGRTEAHSPFGAAEGALLNALMPHLRRALQLHRRIASTEAISDDFAAMLDGTARAMLLVNAAGTVTWMNRAAEHLSKARDGLIVDEGALRAARAADNTRLRGLLSEAAATAMGQGTTAGGALPIGRPSGRRPLMAFVAPLTRRPALFWNGEPPVALVSVSDSEAAPVPDEDTLRSLLGLTAAEATLTGLIARGVTLDEAAARLGLRSETVRTRLKTIFEKTDTHRQADLVRLVLLGATQL